MTAHGVDLVDEHDAGRVLLALLEEVAHARGAHADEHLHEVEPLIEKNGTLASPATARASSVLPVPGEPISSTPLGMRPPSFWNFCGSLRNSMISCSSSLASSTPATSLNVTFFCALEESFARSCRTRGPCCSRLHLPHEEDPEADHQENRAHATRNVAHGLAAGSLADTSTLRSISLLPSPSYCGGAYVRNRSPAFEVPRISLPVSVTFWTCPSSSCLTKSLKVTVLSRAWNVAEKFQMSTRRPRAPSRRAGS